jgi:anti-sigma B factor antagonist
MNLSIETRKIDNVIFLELAGRVSVLDTRLRELAEELVECGERYLVINLANVSYLDNSGLGQLCLIYTLVKNRGGEMKLLKPTPRIRKLLNITKLDTVLKSFECEADAIKSMPILAAALSA